MEALVRANRCLRPALATSSLLLSWLLLLSAAHAQPAAPQPEPAPTPPPTESMGQATTSDQDMTDAQARAHFRLGREYYEQGHFAEAAKEFEVAYGLSGRASLLYNNYIAYRDAQDTPNAARALRGYLAAEPNVADREHLTARLAALEALLKDSEAQAARQRAEAEAAAKQTQEAERERAESERRAADAERRAEQRPSRPFWPWLLVGGGVAASGTGIVLGVLAKNDADDLHAECVADPHTAGASAPLEEGDACAPSVDLESRRDSIKTQATVADVLWISGAVVGVTDSCSPSRCPTSTPTSNSQK